MSPVRQLMIIHRMHDYGRAILLSLILLPGLAGAVPAGTVISNIATATYNGAVISTSNQVDTVTVGSRTPSTIEFMQYAPSSATAQSVPVAITDYSTGGTTAGPFAPLAAPLPAGSSTPINLSVPVPLEPATVYHQGEAIFVRLTDLDQNLDPAMVETVYITITVSDTGDVEVLRLSETGVNTGVFTGYIQSYITITSPGSATSANGQLGLQENSDITASYIDVVDGSDTTSSTVLVDPFGVVFDSSSGLPVDGAQVTLINANTGLPANVFGNDGISTYPSTIISGGSATDSSGTFYDFGPGEYRFPFVAPGNYQLIVVPPAGYSAPSTVSTTTLQTLAGAPYVIDEQGSRALTFVVPVGPALQIDIPVDPGATGFFLVKEAAKQVVSVGDFLQYRLKLTNDTGSAATSVQIVDTLPVGLRYQKGSTTLDGNTVADPDISADGRTLTYNLNNIDNTALSEVRYVVEVGIGTRTGDAVNRAIASANGGSTVSNESAASVRVKQDFLRDRSILMGRVIVDDCAPPDSDQATGLAGVRVYMENGTYAVTDDQGMFHIEGVKPGSHVIQMDMETLEEKYEPVICDEHTRFAGRAFSRFVDLQGGSLWRTDFHVKLRPPPTAEVELLLNSSVDDHVATYHLNMNGGDVDLSNVRLMVVLPETTNYMPGTSVIDNNVVSDPEVMGGVLVYRLGDIPGNWARQLNFLAEAEVNGQTTLLPSKAFLLFDSPAKKGLRTPPVETVMKRVSHEKRIEGEVSPHFISFGSLLSEEDKAKLKHVADIVRDHKVLRIEATGHTDNVRIRERSQGQFANNLALSVARAHSVGQYLASQLDLPESALVVKGQGASKPHLPNETELGRAMNRRVEIHLVTETMLDAGQLTDITVVSNIEIEVEGEWKTLPVPERKTSSEDVRLFEMPDYNRDWVDSAEPGLEILWPQENYNPSIPSIKIAVKHEPSHKVTLLLNGKAVSVLNFSGKVTSASNTVAVSQWRGVDIEKGENTLVVEIRDADGKLIERSDRDVHLSSLPVRIELVEEQSRLIADGRQTPVIAMRLFDKDDQPIREGLVGEFIIEAPHRAQQTIDDLQRQPLAGLDRGNTKYRVGKDGVALIELEPTTKAGEAALIIPLENREVKLRPWLQAAQRDWILVALAEGTVGHNTVGGNLTSLTAAGLEDDTYSDGKVSFFSKGSIRGEWLLTLAYDSDKDEADRNTLFQEIDPDSYFPVYGDKTEQGYDAASTEKLYVRLERKQFYALFGDYQTNLNVTELARYDRTLTGFKSELRRDNFELNVFASETDQNFVKDEIRGDGTSGLYRLSNSSLVFNSDKVRIETRDRFRPQIVLSTQTMARNLDYNVDYDAGTLFFKRPIASKDANLNLIYIVVDYETRDAGAEQWTYGGRGAVKLLGDKAEVGATYINQGKGTGDDTLRGVDATINITTTTQLKAEYATSETGGAQSSDAYMSELSHTSGKVDGIVYYRRQESGFGLGQQTGVGTGTSIYGVDGRYHLTEKFDITTNAFRQTELQTEAERDVLEAGVAYDDKHQGVSLSLQTADDSFSDGTSNKSELLNLAGYQSFLDNQLKLHISHGQSLSDNANPNYPTRSVVGLDYRLNASTLLFVEQEFTHGDNEDTRGTRVGMATQPWIGATINTSLEQRTNEAGPRTFANTGLKQTWKITDKWSVDASVDKSVTIKDPGDTALGSSVPPASASTEDFTATSLGATYQDQGWSWTSRVEHRSAETEDKRGIYTSVVGEPSKGLGVSTRLQAFETETDAGIKGRHADLRVGLVYRPFARRWTFLNRTDLILDTLSGDAGFDTTRYVNNFLVNYRRKSTQVSSYYGSKYTLDTIDSVKYSGYTDSLGVEVRHDINKHWDFAARTSTLHSWNSDQYDYSYGLSVGVNLATNVWLSGGYNWAGYEDDDFSMAGYTAEGPYIKLRVKFDQESVREATNWLNR